MNFLWSLSCNGLPQSYDQFPFMGLVSSKVHWFFHLGWNRWKILVLWVLNRQFAGKTPRKSKRSYPAPCWIRRSLRVLRCLQWLSIWAFARQGKNRSLIDRFRHFSFLSGKRTSPSNARRRCKSDFENGGSIIQRRRSRGLITRGISQFTQEKRRVETRVWLRFIAPSENAQQVFSSLSVIGFRAL